MDLLKYNADRIVREISSVVDRDINFMNEEGIIIASTDKSRIGQVHAGARRVLEENLHELVVKSDDELPGVKEGVNYPLMVGREVVGVIGITGDWSKSVKLGKVTQRMTQIMLTELSVKENKNFEESRRNRYIMEWIGNEKTVINRSFVRRGKQMEIDIALPRRFLILSAQIPYKRGEMPSSLWEVEQAEERIKNYIRRIDPASVYMKTATLLLLGVSSRSDKDMYSLAQSLEEIAKRRSMITVNIGIDEGCHPYSQAYLSYNQAYKALQAGMRFPGDTIRFYKDINMEIFVDEISAVTKKEYVRKLFTGYEEEEIFSALELIRILYENEGSIASASEALHMHKNTLQYKLRRIYERTGYDPRSIRSAPLFQMGLLFFQELTADSFRT